MENPFSKQYSDFEDIKLVRLGIKGDKNALQNLIVRHQLFVYNLALKMTNNIPVSYTHLTLPTNREV